MARDLPRTLEGRQARGLPCPGDWVKHRGDGRLGIVISDRLANDAGDVAVRISHGVTRMCTDGDFFWTRWEKVSPESLAELVLAEVPRG